MKLHILGSGSGGNCAVIEAQYSRVMIDCGFSYRETVRRLAMIGKSPDSIDAIFITHEHSDHIAGLETFCDNQSVPVFASPFTQNAIRMIADNRIRFDENDLSETFYKEDFEITAFSVPHNACQPVNFIFTENGDISGDHVLLPKIKLAYLTDLGSITPAIGELLKGTDLLSIEANYDPEMLAQDASRPAHIRERVLGGQGHLSNAQAASALDYCQPRKIVLTHLSRRANTINKAVAAFYDRIWQEPDARDRLHVSTQDQPFTVEI